MIYTTTINNAILKSIGAFLLLLLLVYDTNGQNLVVYPTVNNDTLSFEVENQFPCTINLTVHSTELDTSFKTVIHDDHSRLLFRWPNPPDTLLTAPNEVFEFDFIFGDPQAIHDDEYEYNLPFPKGKAYRLTQGNKSSFTHNTPRSKYAFDFAIPEGNFVSAARGGVVTHVIEDYKKNAQKRSMIDKGNRIIICHNDGTVAIYAHLQYQGVFVEVGDSIFAGQIIGRSGNTGYSTAPHLHFAVLIADRSIPIRFRNQYTILYEGEIYRHE